MVPSAANTSRDFNQRERYRKASLPKSLSINCENATIFKDQSISLLESHPLPAYLMIFILFAYCPIFGERIALTIADK